MTRALCNAAAVFLSGTRVARRARVFRAARATRVNKPALARAAGHFPCCACHAQRMASTLAAAAPTYERFQRYARRLQQARAPGVSAVEDEFMRGVDSDAVLDNPLPADGAAWDA